MMKREFDELVGMETDQKCYERIEFVYMNSEKFQTKQQLAELYKEKDMNGIEKEYEEILEAMHRDKEFKTFISNLAYYSKDLNCHIKQHLAEKMHQIFNDKTVVKMLGEYRKRSEEELVDLIKDFEWAARNDDAKPLWDNHCLTHATAYNDVIADLTYSEWWHEHAKDFE